MTRPFSFVTPTCSADGYGHAGEQLALHAVRDHGADVAVVGHDWSDERFADPEFLALKVAPDQIPLRDACCVFFLPYALGRFRARTTLSMTMWETDRLPDVWARILGEYADGIIVPSEHCRQVFAERVDRPVRAVPFGTDTSFYTTADRDRTPDEPFIFLMAGLLHYRKGLEFALRALREEFTGSEPVRLVLKTRRGFLDAGSETAMLGDDRVRVIDDDFTRAEMRDLYHSADAFLAPSRGEGSGLTPRDAMSTGLPTILTDWGGLAELADPDCTFPLPVDALEVAPEENTSYGRGVTGGGPIGNFARPSVEHLRGAMRELFEDRDGARERGGRAAMLAREQFTWQRCAGLWLQAVEDLTPVLA